MNRSTRVELNNMEEENTMNTISTTVRESGINNRGTIQNPGGEPPRDKGFFDVITDVVGAGVGTVTGAGSMALHIIPGAAKGIREAFTPEKGKRDDFPFQSMFITQNFLLGTGVAIAAAGVFGSLGGVVVSWALTNALEKKAEKTGAYEKMIESIETRVDHAVKDIGDEGSQGVRKAVQGACIGAGVAAKTGAKVGFDVGNDAVKATAEVVRKAARKVEYLAERTVGDAITGVCGGIGDAAGNIKEGILAGEGQPAEPVNPERTGSRNALGEAVGAPIALANLAISSASGILMGAVTGLSHESTNLNVLVQKSLCGLGYVAAGASAGAALGGTYGAILGGIGGALFGKVTNHSDAAERIVRSTEWRILKGAADNNPDDYFVKRTLKDFTEGTLTGAAFNAAGGFEKGLDSGAGIVSGMVEGARGFAGALAGKYETGGKEGTDTQESTGTGASGSAASFPRKLMRTAAGNFSGATISALTMLDGAIQGPAVALNMKEQASAGVHEGVLSTCAMVAAGAAGLIIGRGMAPMTVGMLMAFAGTRLIHRLNKRTGAAEKVSKGMTSAVRYAQKDNSYMNNPGERKNVYESFRDCVEGGMTAAGAGAREGYHEGYDLGAGLVDGLFDGVKGLTGGARALLAS